MSRDKLYLELGRRLSATPEERAAMHEEDVARYQNRMTPTEVAMLLNVTEKTVQTLPLPKYTPFEHTPTGFREVVRYQMPEFVNYLWRLNPTFCSYSPLEGSLLSPEQVVQLATELRHLVAHNLASMRKHGGGPEF